MGRLLEESGSSCGWSCDNIPAAIGVSVGAGLATAIGGAFVFFPYFIQKVPQSIILGVSLALSAGVMLYVSFIEIFTKSQAEIETQFDPDEKPAVAIAITTACFFGGIIVCILLEVIVHWMAAKFSDSDTETFVTNHDHGGEMARFHSQAEAIAADDAVDVELAPSPAATSTRAVENEVDEAGPGADVKSPPPSPPCPSAGGSVEALKAAAPGDIDKAEKKVLSRMGIMTALAIGVHNFPEGLATFIATVDDISSGASLGIAIAIHNIPEGLCVAMPIYFATGNKWRAWGWSLLSGITEPIGGIAGYAALQPVFTPLVYGIVFSMVGGMMVFIVCHELLPSAHRYMGSTNKASAWFIIGMAVMAASLVLFSI